MFRELPTERRYFSSFKADIWMPGRIVPVPVQLYGHITLSFRRTGQREILSVHLRDARLRLVPFSLPIDVDGDGRLESIELGNVEIDSAVFNLETSRGTLNLETGDFEMSWDLAVTPKHIPMLEKLGGQGMRYTVHDRGKMDLMTGSFEIHQGVTIVEQGPLKGAQIIGKDTTGHVTQDAPPDSTVALSVVITNPQTTSCGDFKNKRVTICEGDTVLLCWTSSKDVTGIDLEPLGLKNLNPNDVKIVKPTAPAQGAPTHIVYSVTTVGGNTPGKRDDVTVEFYRGEWYRAQADSDRKTKWCVVIPPECVSPKIEVTEIQLLKDGCLEHENYTLVHEDPAFPVAAGNKVNVPIKGKPNYPINPVAHAVRFPAPGTWSFFAIPPPKPPDPNDQTSPVCFQFRGQCKV